MSDDSNLTTSLKHPQQNGVIKRNENGIQLINHRHSSSSLNSAEKKGNKRNRPKWRTPPFFVRIFKSNAFCSNADERSQKPKEPNSLLFGRNGSRQSSLFFCLSARGFLLIFQHSPNNYHPDW